MPIATYVGTEHGDLKNEWAEVNGGNSIAMTGGTWAGSTLILDSKDDYLTLSLNNAKSVTFRMKLLNTTSNKYMQIFDCRHKKAAFLMRHNSSGYICSSSIARVYAGTSQFESASNFFETLVNYGHWVTYTVVFVDAFTGDMRIGTNVDGNYDADVEIDEIKVYDVDIVTVDQMNVKPNLADASWHYGLINANTGENIDKTTSITSDAIDISAYAGGYIAFEGIDGNGNDVEDQRVAFYDENDTFI